jgi:hypothetical protein
VKLDLEEGRRIYGGRETYLWRKEDVFIWKEYQKKALLTSLRKIEMQGIYDGDQNRQS